MDNHRSSHIRRLVLFGVPPLYLILGLFHPSVNPEVGDDTSLWIALHAAQLILIGGMAYVLWLLVERLDNRPARVARSLIIPFTIVYTTVDAILGLAWGIVARRANELAETDKAAATRLMDELLEADAVGYLLYFGAGFLWLGVVLAIVTAHSKQAPKPALGLIAAGAVLFGAGHAPPTGPVGMALFLAGIAWLELRPSKDRAGVMAMAR